MQRTIRCGLSIALLALAVHACSEGAGPGIELEVTSRLAADRQQYQLLDTVLSRALPLRQRGNELVVADASPPATARATHRLSAALPLSGAGAVRISAGKLTLEVTPLGRSEVPAQLAGAAAVYPGAHAGADALVVVEPQRVEELVLFRQGALPAVMEYQLRVAAGQGRVRQLEGVVELLDRRGVAWLRLEPPFMVDARGRRHAVGVQLEGDRLRLTLPPLQAPALLDPSWTTTGKMSQGRERFTEVRLKSGKVLVCGGFYKGSSITLKSCDLYDPATGKWTVTGQMSSVRRDFTITLMDNGRVLAVGGTHGLTTLSTAEIYNPATGKWAATASIPSKRRGHTATLLSSGKVLVAGGSYYSAGSKYYVSASLYDPANGWHATGSMQHARTAHSAVRLGDGKVLVVGGLHKGYSVTQAELHDPIKGTWSAVPGVVATVGQPVALLQSGKVLVIGGASRPGTHLFDPTKTQWTTIANPQLLRDIATGSLLLNGKVALAGGLIPAGATTSVELFDPATNKWSIGAPMGTARSQHVAVTLANGAVLVVGGDKPNYETAEVLNSTGGNACKVDKDCVSGFCTDGVCCKSRCHQTCKNCKSNGSDGLCIDVLKYKEDLWPTKLCGAKNACDGAGQCLLKLGQPCTAGKQCASHHCIDGYCCGDQCKDTCKACNVFGKKGSCSPVPAGKPDTSAVATCKGSKACDGNGGCKKAPAWSCAKSAACSTGYCTDGVCCTTACSGTCAACNLAGKKGTCTALAKGKQDPTGAKPCTGKFVCDGKGKCLLPQGATCTVDSQCLTDICKDGYCCDKKCDGTCESCKLSGKLGTCAAITKDKDPDGECLGKDSICGGACDGKRQCIFPGLGTGCGTCKACDGTGRCASRPPDDKACGVLDCDKLDTQCVDYQDIKTGRCISFGSCKPANDPGTCTQKTKLPCGDAGAGKDKGAPGPDQGGAVETDDSGCAAAGGGGRVNLLWLGLLLLLMRRRPHR